MTKPGPGHTAIVVIESVVKKMFAKHAADLHHAAASHFSQHILQLGDHASKSLVSQAAKTAINGRIKVGQLQFSFR